MDEAEAFRVARAAIDDLSHPGYLTLLNGMAKHARRHPIGHDCAKCVDPLPPDEPRAGRTRGGAQVRPNVR